MTHIFSATPEWIEFLQEKDGLDWEKGHGKNGEIILIECTSQELVDLTTEFVMNCKTTTKWGL